MKKIELEILRRARLAILGGKLEGIIHNLNSPLNTVLGYAQILRNSNPELKGVKKIYQAGINIDSGLKNLALNIEKFNSDKPILLNLNKEISNHLKLMNFNLFYKHHVRINTQLAEELPKLAIVTGDLHLVLDNLMNNAIEALQNSEDKQIEIRTAQKNSKLSLQIINSGELKAPEEKLFQANFTTKKNKKLGLGLPLVQYILEKYNAQLSLISKEDKIRVQVLFPIRGLHEKQ